MEKRGGEIAGEWVDNESVWVICATGSVNLSEVMLTYALFGLACETLISVLILLTSSGKNLLERVFIYLLICLC